MAASRRTEFSQALFDAARDELNAGNSQSQKQAGQELRGAVPLNMSRKVAMAPTAAEAPATPWRVRVTATL
jgi:hypothetical protein